MIPHHKIWKTDFSSTNCVLKPSWQAVGVRFLNCHYRNIADATILPQIYVWDWISFPGFTMVYVSSTKHNSEFKEIIIKTMRDLFNMPWLDAIEMVVRNFFWPFREMGVSGLVFGVIYWPVVMPVSIVACLCYCIPLLFVSLRLVTRALKLSSQDDTCKAQNSPGEDCHWFAVMGNFLFVFNIL